MFSLFFNGEFIIFVIIFNSNFFLNNQRNQFNINTGLVSIFDIRINQDAKYGKKNGKSKYNIRNSQELKSLVKNIINS